MCLLHCEQRSCRQFVFCKHFFFFMYQPTSYDCFKKFLGRENLKILLLIKQKIKINPQRGLFRWIGNQAHPGTRKTASRSKEPEVLGLERLLLVCIIIAKYNIYIYAKYNMYMYANKKKSTFEETIWLCLSKTNLVVYVYVICIPHTGIYTYSNKLGCRYGHVRYTHVAKHN